MTQSRFQKIPETGMLSPNKDDDKSSLDINNRARGGGQGHEGLETH